MNDLNESELINVEPSEKDSKEFGTIPLKMER